MTNIRYAEFTPPQSLNPLKTLIYIFTFCNCLLKSTWVWAKVYAGNFTLELLLYIVFSLTKHFKSSLVTKTRRKKSHLWPNLATLSLVLCRKCSTNANLHFKMFTSKIAPPKTVYKYSHILFFCNCVWLERWIAMWQSHNAIGHWTPSLLLPDTFSQNTWDAKPWFACQVDIAAGIFYVGTLQTFFRVEPHFRKSHNPPDRQLWKLWLASTNSSEREVVEVVGNREVVEVVGRNPI